MIKIDRERCRIDGLSSRREQHRHLNNLSGHTRDISWNCQESRADTLAVKSKHIPHRIRIAVHQV